MITDGLSAEARPSTLVEVSGTLTEGALSRLIGDEVLAILVPDFAGDEVVQRARDIFADKPLENYTYFDQPSGTHKDLGVKRFGIPFNTTYKGDYDALTDYYDQVPGSIHQMREEFSPNLYPIDHLRLLLDELWPEGASVASHSGKKNFVGMYREVRGSDAVSLEAPHFDALPSHLGKLTQQFAANIYIDVPEEGGELLLWPTEQIEMNSIKGYQGTIEFQKLVATDPVRICPKVGMLALFCASKPHAIAGFQGDIRSSLQCFIGLEQDRHLALWN